MTVESNWRTEFYKGFDVYVLAIPRAERVSGEGATAPSQWDFVVRICESGRIRRRSRRSSRIRMTSGRCPRARRPKMPALHAATAWSMRCLGAMPCSSRSTSDGAHAARASARACWRANCHHSQVASGPGA